MIAEIMEAFYFEGKKHYAFRKSLMFI